MSEKTHVSNGWEIVQFGDVVRDVKESERNPLEAGLERYIGLEHIEPENLQITEWGDLTQDEISFTKRFRKGQVLFGKRRAYQRKVAVAEFDGICSSDILTFEPKNDSLIPELLPFIVQSDAFFNHALDTSSGSLSPRTRWSQLRDFEFPLPPKSEQERISRLMMSVTDSKSAWQRTASACNRLITAIIDNYMTGQNNGNADFSSWQCPVSWEMSTIGEMVEFQGGSQPPRDDFEYSPREGNIRLIQIRDYKTDDFITFIPREKSKRFCEVDDVMIGRYGPPIFQILKGIEGSYNVALIKATPKDGLKKLYLYYYLKQTPLLRHIDHLSQRSSGQTGVDMDALRQFPLPLPPEDEQNEITSLIQEIEEKVATIQSHIQRLSEMKTALFTPGNK